MVVVHFEFHESWNEIWTDTIKLIVSESMTHYRKINWKFSVTRKL